MVTVGVVCNAAFTSSSRPSEDTLYSLGNLPHNVQVQLSFTFLSLRLAALTLNTPLVINLGIKSQLGLKSPHWPDVLAPPCRSICVVPHWSAVVTAVASSNILEHWATYWIHCQSWCWVSTLPLVPHPLHVTPFFLQYATTHHCVRVPQHLSQTLSHSFFPSDV